MLSELGVAEDEKADSLLYQTQRTFWLLKDCQQQYFVPEVGYMEVGRVQLANWLRLDGCS